MDDLNDLYYFVQVVNHQGFAPAGRALGIPKSRLSRRIADLERRLGVRLIHRSTRRFVVTDLGQQFYERCRAMLIESEAAREIIETHTAAPRGLIKLSCPVGLLSFHAGEMLAEFMVRYPDVSIQLESTNRRVDVIAEGFDLAIRVRPLPLEDSDLVLRILSDRGTSLVASPALVNKYGNPQVPDDLSVFPSLDRSTPQESHEWILKTPEDEEIRVLHKPRYITTDMHALKSAAVAGVGIVQLPTLMLFREIGNGSLVRLLPDWQPRREVIHLVYPSRRGMLPSVRNLIDFLANKYTSLDEEDTPSINPSTLSADSAVPP